MIIQAFMDTFLEISFLFVWVGRGRNITLNFNRSDFETKMRV